MSAATLNGVTQATFAYDAYGQRIVKTNPLIGAETHYIYDDAGQLLAEMDGVTGEPIREYIWLGKVPIGYVDRLGAGGASPSSSSTTTTWAARKSSPIRRATSPGTASSCPSARSIPSRALSITC
jgi:YD repeat-containing protein